MVLQAKKYLLIYLSEVDSLGVTGTIESEGLKPSLLAEYSRHPALTRTF